MLTQNTRIIYRITAYLAANVGFLILQRQLGWKIAFAVAFMTGAARLLARADAGKDVEDLSGLPK